MWRKKLGTEERKAKKRRRSKTMRRKRNELEEI